MNHHLLLSDSEIWFLISMIVIRSDLRLNGSSIPHFHPSAPLGRPSFSIWYVPAQGGNAATIKCVSSGNGACNCLWIARICFQGHPGTNCTWQNLYPGHPGTSCTLAKTVPWPPWHQLFLAMLVLWPPSRTHMSACIKLQEGGCSSVNCLFSVQVHSSATSRYHDKTKGAPPSLNYHTNSVLPTLVGGGWPLFTTSHSLYCPHYASPVLCVCLSVRLCQNLQLQVLCDHHNCQAHCCGYQLGRVLHLLLLSDWGIHKRVFEVKKTWGCLFINCVFQTLGAMYCFLMREMVRVTARAMRQQYLLRTAEVGPNSRYNVTLPLTQIASWWGRWLWGL